jgi:adenylate cyclase
MSTQPVSLRIRKKRWNRGYWLVQLLLLLAFLALAIAKPRTLDDLSNFVFDSFQRASPRIYDPGVPVRIVDIDEASLRRLGQWPWPRSRLAELVERLHDAGARTIGFDIVFADADRTSPENVVGLLPAGPVRNVLQRDLAALEPNDARFARGIEGRSVVLGALFPPSPPKSPVDVKFGLATAGDDAVSFLAPFGGSVAPLPLLQKSAAGIGALNWLPDRDQVVRRAPLFIAFDGAVFPSLAAEMLRVGQDASTFVLKASNASGETAFGAKTGLVSARIGDLEIPTSARGDIRVRYSVHEPTRFLPAWQVLQSGRLDEVRDRLILIGSSAAGLADLRATPLDPSVPGVEVHAQLLEHMLEGRALVRPDWGPGFELLALLIMGMTVAGAAALLSPLLGAAVAFLLLVGAWSGSFLAFSRFDLLIDPLLPSISTAVLALGGAVMLFSSERRRRMAVRSAFSRFVAPELVAQISENPDSLRLGGENRTITLMFCDVRDFTSIAEGMSAEELTAFMNGYLAPMSDIILSHRGTIDKYMGDAIMAFWNAPLDDPDHGRHAVEAARSMLRSLESLNRTWADTAQSAGRPFQPVRIGIGLSTGLCCVGNFGTEQRFDYSALGDEVNVASRIENLTKSYGIALLASEETVRAAPGVAWRAVDTVQVKGRKAPVKLFTFENEG